MIALSPRPTPDYATETGQQSIVDKIPSDLITEVHDDVQIVYLGNGEIDYIRYMNNAVEVARKTFNYTGPQLTGITKTP